MIKIIENTLRDGSYLVDFNIDKDQTSNISGGLSRLGFDFIEVGHGLGLGAYNNIKCGLSKEDDFTYITSAVQVSPNSSIGVFFIPGIGTFEDIDLAISAGIKFIRIGINVDIYKEAKKYIDYAKKKGLFVAINLMKSYGVKSYEFMSIAKNISSWKNVDVIYLVDSAGCMMPDEVFEYIDRTIQKIDVQIGFHGHNNLSMAVSNTISAVKAGATYIDTCVRGMGRSAGNAQTEIVVYMLQNMGLITKDINIYDLYKFADEVIDPISDKIKGITSEEIHIGISKFHSSYNNILNAVSEEFKIDRLKLMQEVSEVNCINPSVELFKSVAQKIQ